MTEEEQMEAELAGEPIEPIEPEDENNEDENNEEPKGSPEEEENKEVEGEGGGDEPETETDEGGAGVEEAEVGVGEATEGTEGQGDSEPAEDSGELEVLPPESGELMSPGDIDRQARNDDWAEGLSVKVGVGISINGNGLTIIDPDTDPEAVKGALEYVSDIELSSANMRQVMQMSIGKFIAFIAESERKDRTTVISELDVCDSFGRKIDTVLHWVRVAEEIPDECLSYGLSMSHYIAAAVVRKPKDKVDLADFLDFRKDVLKNAAASPSEYPSRQVRRDLEAFVEEVEPSKKSKPDVSSNKLKSKALDLRRFRDAAAIDNELLDMRGMSMGDLSSEIESIENELIDREELVADVTKITFKLDSDLDESDEPITEEEDGTTQESEGKDEDEDEG